MSGDVRPRFGQIMRRDGTSEPLVFVPTDKPTVFRALLAGDETPVRLGRGDEVRVDVLGPGQSVTFEAPDGDR